MRDFSKKAGAEACPGRATAKTEGRTLKERIEKRSHDTGFGEYDYQA
jgi:hypothetical protein